MAPSIPESTDCCGCVTDLKTAASIIAVLAIVTSPAVAWAAVRHSYVIRISCYATATSTRPDVVDINLHNVLSFGFGANAGLGPSCLGGTKQLRSGSFNGTSFQIKELSESSDSTFLTVVKHLGWFVLFGDTLFLASSVYLLYKIFNGPDKNAAYYFLITGILSVILSFIYGLLYIAACVENGGAFPIIEFVFTIIDFSLWFYFLLVVHSYRVKTARRVNQTS